MQLGDNEAVAQSLAGQPDAFATLVHRHGQAVHGYLFRRSDRQTADDLIGEVWLRAFRHVTRFLVLIIIGLVAASFLTPSSAWAKTAKGSARTSASAAKALPLDAYSGADQSGAEATADSLLIAACMKSRGFEYKVTQQSAASPTSSQETEPYGITNRQMASEYGYGARLSSKALKALKSGQTVKAGQPAKPLQAPGSTPHSAAYNQALAGNASGTVTPGDGTVKGCEGKALVQLDGAGDVPPDPTDLVGQLSSEALSSTEADSRVAAVERAWSSCMAKKGFVYSTPMSPQQVVWPVPASSLEIATAVQDVRCKQQTDLPSIWLKVEAGYQTKLINTNLAALNQIKQASQAMLDRADAVLAKGS